MKYDWNKRAEKYDKLQRIDELLVKRFRRRLIREAQGDVLELAIGTGANIKFYPQNCRLTGIDISEEMLFKSRNKAFNLSLPVDLFQADAIRLPFQDNSFDTVLETLALCTYSNPLNALNEMQRVCRPDGLILLLEHGISSYKCLAKLQKKSTEWHQQKFGCYWHRNHLEIAKQSGLKIISAERYLLGIIYLIESHPSK